MLYTFEFTPSVLQRVEHYLDQHFQDQHREYIMGVQHRISDDLLFVVIECTPETATLLHMMS